MAGLIKSILCLHNTTWVGTKTLTSLNPMLKVSSVSIPKESTKLTSDTIGVSSFGFGGANAHAVLSNSKTEPKSISTPISWKHVHHVPKSIPTKQQHVKAGIHAFECHFPGYYIEMSELEDSDSVSGKYTEGLNQKQMGFTGDNEDAVSFALTALTRLVERCNISFKDIGRLEVGTESQTDRSKSIKSNLMALFEECGNYDVEGADTYNACYGGTNAFLNTINWIESANWDGRYGVAIMTDIAYEEGNYLFGGGGGVVAVLLGSDAPVTVLPIRASSIRNAWDFYKPIHQMPHPNMDLKNATNVYITACLCAYKSFVNKAQIDKEDLLKKYKYFVFHGANNYMPKVAFHKIYEWIVGHEVDRKNDATLNAIFEEKIRPSMSICARTGSNYTSAVYLNLISLFTQQTFDEPTDILVYSYGSGCASTVFQLHVDTVPLIPPAFEYLDKRTYKSIPDFMEIHEHVFETYQHVDVTPMFNVKQPGVYYLTKIDTKGRRFYEREPKEKLIETAYIESEETETYVHIKFLTETMKFNKPTMDIWNSAFHSNKPLYITSECENFWTWR